MDSSAATPSISTQRAASRVLAPRKPPLLPVAPRHAFRVLQTSQAPAQLSLFLRPGTR
jgi:hypothetical protein